MKILFVDNDRLEFDKFRELPFGRDHAGDIEFRDSPVGLGELAVKNEDLRLIVLDILWQKGADDEGYPLGVDAMRDLSRDAPDVPVVIYSLLDNEAILRNYVPEMMRLGAYDWISKTESRMLRSFRFERAFNEGRNSAKRPTSRAILPADQRVRSNVHVAVMFVDMSGFTALTDKIGAQEVVDILADFYSMVSREVLAYGGYVDKYIGDAVMAVFGAIDVGGRNYSHVRDGIQVARLIQARAAEFRLKRVEPVLKRSNVQGERDALGRIGLFRVGIESGPVEIARFERGNEAETTFIGTPVNIASRLLGHARPGEVWIGVNAFTNGGMASDVLEEIPVEHKNLPGDFTAYKVRI